MQIDYTIVNDSINPVYGHWTPDFFAAADYLAYLEQLPRCEAKPRGRPRKPAPEAALANDPRQLGLAGLDV